VARIADTSVEAVKAAADVVEVISGRTQLKRSGARFTGLCPFHDERTPSFSVSPEKGTYYCFGCQRGGDAISFVEETEGVDFVGAIEWLAQRFSIPLEYEEASPEQDAKRRRRERLYAVLDAAASFYGRYLWESQAGAEVPAGPRGPGFDARAQGGRARLHSAGAHRRRASEPTRKRLLPGPPALPDRGRARSCPRLPGAAAAAGRSPSGEVRQLA